ncbi:response regulator, partial [bacterium]
PEDALLLRRLLEREGGPGFHPAFETAGTLAAGLTRLAKGGVDVALLDLMLPDSRGMETAGALLARFPKVPFVVLTGLSDEQLGLQAVRLGAQDYVVKGSMDARALKRVISYAVHRHRTAAGLKSVIDRSADGMVVVDAGGVVRYLNPAAAALLGGEAAVLAGRPFPFPLPTEGLSEVALPPAPEARVAELRVTAIEWDDEPAVLATLRDMTDLRRVAELKAEVKEQRRMDKLKNELMSAISHEMRSPLTVIKAANINMKDGSTGPLNDEQSTMVLLQHKNILRLQKILDHILDLSRLESGRAVVRPTRVEAGGLAAEVARGYQLLADERGVRIELELPSDLPPVFTDPDLFAQVLGNLLDNAVRFTGSKIRLRAEALSGVQAAQVVRSGGPVLAERGCVRFCVADDGRGIPPERIGDIFKRFVQVDRAAGGEDYKGTGLGLAICKEIVERQGGRIWAESGGGPGARFYFTLPLCEPDEGD